MYNFSHLLPLGLTLHLYREYDSNYHSPGLDEVYFDLTRFVLKNVVASNESICHTEQKLLRQTRQEFANSIVYEIRKRITEVTGGLTCSAGIAANFLLAKIAADVKKPDGQYLVPLCRAEVLRFIGSFPVRKIPGVGKVTEKMLNSLEINTVEDIRRSLHLLRHVLSPIQYNFFLHASLGVVQQPEPNTSGCPVARAANESENETQLGEGREDSGVRASVAEEQAGINRKSIGAERTFPATSNRNELKVILHDICRGLAKDMAAESLKAYHVTVKIKLSTFEVSTRGRTMRRAVHSPESLLDNAFELLSTPWPEGALRLLGVSTSRFVEPIDRGKSCGVGTENNIMKFLALPSPAASHKPSLLPTNMTGEQYLESGEQSSDLERERQGYTHPDLSSGGGNEGQGASDNLEGPERTSWDGTADCDVMLLGSKAVSEHDSPRSPAAEGRVTVASPSAVTSCDCPVCGRVISGDEDFLTTHVTYCLDNSTVGAGDGCTWSGEGEGRPSGSGARKVAARRARPADNFQNLQSSEVSGGRPLQRQRKLDSYLCPTASRSSEDVN